MTSSLNMYSNFQSQRQAVSDQQQLIAKEATHTVKSFVQDKFSELHAAAGLYKIFDISHREQKLILETF